MKHYFFLFFVLSVSLHTFSQQKRIKIVHADNSNIDQEKYPNATILLGNVFIEHEGISLRSKKAIHYKDKNLLEAFGDVVLNQGDTVTQTSKYVHYNGDTKKALSWGNVVLKDPVMTLETDTLYFDRNQQLLYYKDNAVIRDSTNVLKSKSGNYYLNTTKFEARTDVVLTNPDYVLKSNNLDYFTDSGKAYLYGPSTITGENNFIYTENGFYDTKLNISHFTKNSRIEHNNREIKADSLYYDRNLGYASATKNIQLKDTINDSVIRGGYAEFFQELDSAYVVDRAVAVMEIEKDSMYIHGDTLLATGKPEKRVIRAFNRVKFFKSNLSGKCDSIHSDQATGVTEFFKNPVMWSDENQITGDTIKLLSNTKTEKLDSLKVIRNAFMVQKDSTGYNQIKGRNILGKFIDNELHDVSVIGNGEMIQFVRSEKTQELIGIDKTICSSMKFLFEDKKIKEAFFYTDPDGITYPPSKLPEAGRKLKGFIWRENERPLTKDDIFIKDDEVPKPPKSLFARKEETAKEETEDKKDIEENER